MNSITVPQVEYIGGRSPQENAALLNARIIELRFNKPTFERDGDGFWITYSKDIEEKPKGAANSGRIENVIVDRPVCGSCPYFEPVSDRVKWGKCPIKDYACVNKDSTACASYPKEGGGELNA